MVDPSITINVNATDINELVIKTIIPFGFELFSIRLFHFRSLTKTERVVIENYPPAWRKYYDDNNFHDIDPILIYAKSSSTPVHWETLNNGELAGGEGVLTSATRFGIGPGFSIPVRGKTGTLAIVSVNTQGHYPGLENYASCIKEMLAIMPYILEKMLLSLQQQMIKLTRREQECLFWACEGKTAWEIAQIVGCSDRTVVFHLNNISEKFGTQNRYQTITHALLTGAITPQFG